MIAHRLKSDTFRRIDGPQKGEIPMAEKKEYRSALRSRRLIRQAFQELLREKPFEKITVTDIVKRADINRSTFYAHYPDVRGLVEELLSEVVERSVQLVAEINYNQIFEDPTVFLDGLLEIGMEHLEIYKLMGRSDFVLRQVEQIKIEFLEQAVTTVDVPEHIRQSHAYRIQLNFFIGGIMNTFQQWMTGALDCPVEEIMEQLAQLIRNNASAYQHLKF